MPSTMFRRVMFVLPFFLALATASAPLPAQEKSVRPGINKNYENADLKKQVATFEGEGRDVVKKKDAILAACLLKPGMTVADIGAGTGLFTRLMAPKIAPGRLYAVDINKPFVEHILASCREKNLANVTGVVCPQDSTGLAAQSIDLAFLCDTYHHFEFPHRTLASIYAALRPGGKLVLLDFDKAGAMKDHVRADKKSVIAEVQGSGFTLVDEVKDVPPNQYLVRFEKRLRAPAVPLVVHDPYFSIWSCADRLTDDWPRHWTGAPNALSSMIRIDGQAFRLMGLGAKLPALRQVGVEVLPTRTIYDFEDCGVHVRLTFLTPLLPGDLELIGRPVTYLSWEVKSADGRDHDVSVYYDNSAELVVDKASQNVFWSRPAIEGFQVLRMGSADQPVLAKSGDNLRIDWGYLYAAAPAGPKVRSVVADHESARGAFAKEGRLPEKDDSAMPRPAQQEWPVAAFCFDLGKVGKDPGCCNLMLAYDDLYSIEYLGKKLRPYWRRSGAEAADLLRTAAKDQARLARECEAFDRDLMADLTRVGGPGYANLCALSYREAIGAHKLAAGPGDVPMLFPKENFSNGCIATVDVTYPAAPIFALLSNDLLKASVVPIFDYSATGRWKFPFAPHDLGTYPKANGQVYGGGERTEENQMPVEESGNLLLVAAVISKLDGNTRFVDRYWPQLARWAEFLKQKGLDPENQLCTDDFAGHLAHNANLSLKAILALGAYARMCGMSGKTAQEAEYRRTAEEFARQWVKLAADGDHYRLAFDKPGTWSQKYNLVWDKLLGLNLFPPEVARKEIAFYKTKLDCFGLPLDNRENYTKTDWEVWTATLAESRFAFDALMGPAYGFVNRTEPRVPLTDWYMTRDARQRGFQARPVIGGVFIKMLDDPAVWKKWAERGKGQK